jgi:hypothetical protein
MALIDILLLKCNFCKKKKLKKKLARCYNNRGNYKIMWMILNRIPRYFTGLTAVQLFSAIEQKTNLYSHLFQDKCLHMTR